MDSCQLHWCSTRVDRRERMAQGGTTCGPGWPRRCTAEWGSLSASCLGCSRAIPRLLCHGSRSGGMGCFPEKQWCMECLLNHQRLRGPSIVDLEEADIRHTFAALSGLLPLDGQGHGILRFLVNYY